MADHYNAFISYKHAPEDIRVAEAVQRGLEHYHIPTALRKKTGIKKIERVFRDKDELPITSDLTDDISHALENADYLIVICSTHTKESVWVPREIEYFLKNHTKRQILTVLVDGEPQDVIPEILQKGEREITDAEGNTQTIEVCLEPLSCDYRGSIRKANKEELPRLAAALIGCSYDELMNRSRQYKMRRMALIFAGALAIVLVFCGYMAYSRVQIEKSYQETLRSQSKYLANEAQKLLKNEQRITAMQLALAALPSDENDERPITPEAIRAITDTTMAYHPLSGINMEAVWNYRLPGVVEGMAVSPSGTSLAAYSDTDAIVIWDTQTHEEIFKDGYTHWISGMKYFSDTRVLIWSSDILYCYDIEAGDYIWQYEPSAYISVVDNMFQMADGNLGVLTNEGMAVLNVDTGEEVKQITFPEYREGGEEALTYNEVAFSPDGKRMAFVAVEDINDGNLFGILDLITGELSVIEPEEVAEGEYESPHWTDDNHLLITNHIDREVENQGFGSQEILATSYKEIFCIDATEKTVLWKNDFTSNDITMISGFFDLPAIDAVAYYCGNVCDTYNLETGERIYTHNVNDCILNISDLDGDGSPLLVTRGGGLVTPLPDSGKDVLGMNRRFADHLNLAEVNNGVFIHQERSHEIIYYNVYVYDEDWTVINDPDTHEYSAGEYGVYDDMVALLFEEDESGVVLQIVDPETTDVVYQETVDEDSQMVFNYRILGAKDGKLYFGDDAIDELTIWEVDPVAGTSEVCATIPDALSVYSLTFDEVEGNAIYLTDDFEGNCTLSSYNLETGEVATYDLPVEDLNTGAEIYYNSKSKVACIGIDDASMRVDLKTGDADYLNLPEDMYFYKMMTVGDSGDIAYYDGKKVYLLDDQGDYKASVDCGNMLPAGMYFYEDTERKERYFLITYDDGSLIRYDADNAGFIAKSDISAQIYDYSQTFFTYDPEQRLLFVQKDGLLSLVETDSWIELAAVENCIGYHPGTDRFFAFSYQNSSEKQLGWFKHYTVEDLKQKAKDILQDAQMPEETKSYYGIE